MEMIGINIKRLRQEKGFTLKEFASKVSVSASFISQVESGKISPSLSKLKNIADSLNTTVGLLIGENSLTGTSNPSPVVRKDERKQASDLGDGINVRLLSSPDPYKQMEPLLITMVDKAISGDKPYQHYGQEFILVLKGKCEIVLNNTKYILNKGDSIYFNSNTPHSFRNLSEGNTEAVWVITPPSF